ncbi:tRNA uridine-5-carboxymethylaminomethyl(34) synthesis enzyme MnmG [Deltaproteobacteria bacterium OttesenSCG-928-K17]|nr:tRNA uridine-5-carboxymethylaminomethyl(34) synthesis enzyme MnmG [Deltaproteobacteria bacterium OttesenSCG-928-K17]
MKCDVVVVGGGHAGLEAALASARLGAATILVTQKVETIGVLSCNPAFGGPAKGNVVREVDAMGGFCGRMADLAARQCRTLGESKGPAARSTRILVDRAEYAAGARAKALEQNNLSVIEGEAVEIIIDGRRVAGVKLADGRAVSAGAVVLSGGTFWRASIHRGRVSTPAGRVGETAANQISLSLEALGHKLGRLSTCTAPRLKAETIDAASLEIQPGQDVQPFSSLSGEINNTEVCRLTWTTPETHRIVREGLKDSIFYSGFDPGAPPRYCPSIEDKIFHYPQRERHNIFLEPDGPGIIFPSGIPTGLAPEVQLAMMRSLPGLEKVELAWPGYAIEYDFADPRDLAPTFESLKIKGLFLAGQINGTSGYEEAAGQGLMAGVNAAGRAFGGELLALGRAEAMTGVLADDLTTRGITEPYRLFPSRAEWRLMLREDNADLRLSPKAEKLGLLDAERAALFHQKLKDMATGRELLESTRVSPDQSRGLGPEALEVKEAISAAELLKRPAARLSHFLPLIPALADLSSRAVESLEIEIKFAGYIRRQEEEVARLAKEENLPIPPGLDFMAMTGLSAEVKETLTKHRPATLGQAGRLAGMTPAALTVLAVQLKTGGR